MSEDKKRTRNIDKARRRIGRFWFASIILATVIIILCLVKISLWNLPSADEQLAAIEAARADAHRPSDNGPFVYKRDGDEFIFYSKGPNNIDEGGSHSGTADDWSIWPLNPRITKQDNANDK